MNQNYQNSNLKKLLGFRNMQEKLEKSRYRSQKSARFKLLVFDIEIRFWHFLTVIYGHLTSLDKQKTIRFFIMISLPGKTLIVVLSPAASSHGFLFIWRTNSLKKIQAIIQVDTKPFANSKILGGGDPNQRIQSSYRSDYSFDHAL